MSKNSLYKQAEGLSKTLMSIVFDIISATLAIIGIFMTYSQSGAVSFIYYTILSNCLAIFACIIHAVVAVFCLIRKSTGAIHKFAKCLKYGSAVCLGITFVVVLFILAPAYEENGIYLSFISGANLYVHLLCPLFVMLSFVLFDKNTRLPMRAAHFSLIPTYIYGIIAVTMNALGKWDGPYFFLRIMHNPPGDSLMWCVVVLAIAYIVSTILLLFNGNRFHAIISIARLATGKKHE